MADDVVRDIPEEMVEKAARELFGGPHYRLKAEGGEYTVTWEESDEAGPFGRAVYRGQARRILSAALAGRTVVELPSPDVVVDSGTNTRASVTFDVDSCIVTAREWSDGQSKVHVRGGPTLDVDEAERRGAALIAAAREARRMADAVSLKGGDQDD